MQPRGVDKEGQPVERRVLLRDEHGSQRPHVEVARDTLTTLVGAVWDPEIDDNIYSDANAARQTGQRKRDED